MVRQKEDELKHVLTEIGKELADSWSSTYKNYIINKNDNIVIYKCTDDGLDFEIELTFESIEKAYDFKISKYVSQTKNKKIGEKTGMTKTFEAGQTVMEVTVGNENTEAMRVGSFVVKEIKEFVNGRFAYFVPEDVAEGEKVKAVRRKIKTDKNGYETCGGVVDKANVIAA